MRLRHPVAEEAKVVLLFLRLLVVLAARTSSATVRLNMLLGGALRASDCR